MSYFIFFLALIGFTPAQSSTPSERYNQALWEWHDTQDGTKPMVSELKSLTHLSLDHVNRGILPEALSQLTNLEKLSLNCNKLARLPDWIGSLSRLAHLELSQNDQPVLPETITKLIRLGHLDLSQNDYCEVPSVLCSLTTLVHLDLSGNELLGLPPSISQLVRLEVLTAHSNRLTNLPVELKGLTALRILDISNNWFRKYPPVLNLMTGLKRLFSKGNQIQNGDPVWFDLNMRGVQFSPEEPLKPASASRTKKPVLIVEEDNFTSYHPPSQILPAARPKLRLPPKEVVETQKEIAVLSTLLSSFEQDDTKRLFLALAAVNYKGDPDPIVIATLLELLGVDGGTADAMANLLE